MAARGTRALRAAFASRMPDNLADIALRLVAAAVAGGIVGVNRDLHGKPVGVRTLGLVAFAAAIVAVSVTNVDGIRGNPGPLGRVLQGTVEGVMTGIGFLGAGLIMRGRDRNEIHNLTTAASVWITAALGISCAVASWWLVGIGVAITLMILLLGGRVERLFWQAFPHKPDSGD